MRNLDVLKPTEMRQIIRAQDEALERYEELLHGEQRAYKTLMLSMVAQDPEKAEDALQQVEDMKRRCTPEPEYIVSIPCLALGILMAITGDLPAGLIVLAFATVHKENAEKGSTFTYTLDMDKIKGWFRRGKN